MKKQKKSKKKTSLGGKLVRKAGAAILIAAVSGFAKKLFENELERGIIAAVKKPNQQ